MRTIDGFLIHIAPDCADGTTTQIRYLKLIDRLTRYLVDVGVRQENPAATMLLTQSWPEDEPTPVYLSFEDDERLQRSLVVPDGLYPSRSFATRPWWRSWRPAGSHPQN